MGSEETIEVMSGSAVSNNFLTPILDHLRFLKNPKKSQDFPKKILGYPKSQGFLFRWDLGTPMLNLYEYEYFCAGVYVLWCHDLCASDSVFFKSHLETSSCRINPKKKSSNDEDGSGLSHMFSISVIGPTKVHF